MSLRLDCSGNKGNVILFISQFRIARTIPPEESGFRELKLVTVEAVEQLIHVERNPHYVI